MRHRIPCLVLLCGTFGLHAQIPLYRNPSRALGQSSLRLTAAVPNLIEGRELSSPQSAAIDTTSNPPAIYVADTVNHRVLAWRDARTFRNGATADFVIGQPDFVTANSGGPATSAPYGFLLPSSVAVNRRGDLWVLDSGNNRLLRFPKPLTRGDYTPDLVVGQTGFDCTTCNLPNSGGISAATIAVSGTAVFGAAIAFDPNGNLWFLDTGNHRVLRFSSAVAEGGQNGPEADLVLGQLDFSSKVAAAVTTEGQQDRAHLRFPSGVGVDPAGRLFVADSLDRVLVWEFAFASGQSANRLVGIYEPPEDQTTPAANDQVFEGPEGIFFVNGGLGVADTRNHRLMLFDPYEQWPAESTLFSPRARAVVGQPDFDSGNLNRGQPEAAANSLNLPTHAAVAGGELFVVDSGSHRVLVFPTAGLGANSAATRVLGQDDFTGSARNLIEGREFNFQGNGTYDGSVVVDWNSDPPILYVADTYNNRILGFRDVRRIKSGDKADLVIGQPDLRHALINYPTNDTDQPSAQSLYLPTGLLVDASGNLYVADSGNGRVLRFPRPFAGGNYPRANLVLGQSNFVSKITDPTSTRMRAPYGLALAGANGLLVSDLQHHRVLFFRGALTDLVNGQAAAAVFGQPNFNASTPGSGDNQMRGPRHLAVDPQDRLYVADSANNRILIFNRASSSSPDPRAAALLTTSSPGSTLNEPRGVFVNPVTGEIWVSELRTSRVSRYPRFDDLVTTQFSSNLQLPTGLGAVGVTQDRSGNVYYAEISSRVAAHYPLVSAVNAANFITDRPLSPGVIATLYGQGEAFTSSLVVGPGSPMSKQVGGIQVVVDGKPSPIFAVASRQVNFVLPQDLPTSGLVEVEVVRVESGQVLGAGLIPMARVSPALFTVASSGTGQLAAINEDGSVNSATAQVGRGKVISLFGTGFGIIQGAPPDGVAPTGAISTPFKPRVWVNNWVPEENVLYSGVAPGLVGVWQINVRIPQQVPPNNTILVFLEVDGILSVVPGQRPTIAVKQE